MSSPGNSHAEEPELEARLRSLPNIDQLNTCSLTLSAAGISHRIQPVSTQHFEIYVSIADLQVAADELQHYEEENRNWPPAPTYDSYAPVFRAMSVIVVALLIYVYGLSGEWSNESPWFIKGAGDSAAILSLHQYYRLITALTLHADAVHLLGNCVLGSFLLHFLLLTTGNGIGLFSVLVSAALANYINVIVHGAGHHFVGFSTAVFVVIGMLCTIRFAGRAQQTMLPYLMPVMAGFALLALLGSSGERTDLGAHLFGLLCGLITGNIVRLKTFTKWRKSMLIQVVLVLLALGIVFMSWLKALSL